MKDYICNLPDNMFFELSMHLSNTHGISLRIFVVHMPILLIGFKKHHNWKAMFTYFSETGSWGSSVKHEIVVHIFPIRLKCLMDHSPVVAGKANSMKHRCDVSI